MPSVPPLFAACEARLSCAEGCSCTVPEGPGGDGTADLRGGGRGGGGAAGAWHRDSGTADLRGSGRGGGAAARKWLRGSGRGGAGGCIEGEVKAVGGGGGAGSVSSAVVGGV